MTSVNNIITLAPAAQAHIKRIMSRSESGHIFRLSVKKTGCSGYMYEPQVVTAPKAGDIEVNGAANDFSVFVDPASVPLLQGTTVDFIKKEFGQEQLAFDNPNAVGMCGCGESFHLKEEANDS